jgi:hypothetical protein
VDASSPSPRLRGEGRGEGRFLKLAKEHPKNSVQIPSDIVVPNPDHAITKRAQPAVALPVRNAFRVLAAVDFDNQTRSRQTKST